MKNKMSRERSPHPISLSVLVYVQVTYPSFRKHMTGKAGAENTEKTIQNLVHDIKKIYIENQRATRQSTGDWRVALWLKIKNHLTRFGFFWNRYQDMEDTSDCHSMSCSYILQTPLPESRRRLQQPCSPLFP